MKSIQKATLLIDGSMIVILRHLDIFLSLWIQLLKYEKESHLYWVVLPPIAGVFLTT